MKELTNSDSVSLDHVHDLGHKSINSLGPSKININWLISRFDSSVRLVDFVLKASTVVQEWQVINVSQFGSVVSHN